MPVERVSSESTPPQVLWGSFQNCHWSRSRMFHCREARSLRLWCPRSQSGCGGCCWSWCCLPGRRGRGSCSPAAAGSPGTQSRRRRSGRTWRTSWWLLCSDFTIGIFAIWIIFATSCQSQCTESTQVVRRRRRGGSGALQHSKLLRFYFTGNRINKTSKSFVLKTLFITLMSSSCDLCGAFFLICL